MATPGQPFDRNIINVRERPLSSDVDYNVTYADRSLRFAMSQLYGVRTSPTSELLTPATGFIGSGLEVVPNNPLGLSVLVKAGLGFMNNPSDLATAIDGVPGVDDQEPYKPVVLSADLAVTVAPAPPLGQERWDIIEVKYGRDGLGQSATRDVFNATTKVFDPTLVQKLLTWDVLTQFGTVNAPANSTTALSRKIGVQSPVGTNAIPAASPGYVVLAAVYVGPAATTIDYDVVVDRRKLLTPGGVVLAGANFTSRTDVVGAANNLQNIGYRVPAGMRATLLADDATIATHRLIKLYLFGGVFGAGGALPVSVTASGSWMVNGADPGSTQLGAINFSLRQGTVDAALQTLLQGATAFPAIKVAIGQSFTEIEMFPIAQNAGSTAQTNFPVTTDFSVSVEIQTSAT